MLGAYGAQRLHEVRGQNASALTSPPALFGILTKPVVVSALRVTIALSTTMGLIGKLKVWPAR